jgi:uncharacterized coiled-coil protein SlyX
MAKYFPPARLKLGPNRRFEKEGPYESNPFTFADVPSEATRLIRCHNMQGWVDAAISTLPDRFIRINQKIAEMEALIDSRHVSQSEKAYEKLSEKMQNLTNEFGDAQALVQEALRNQLAPMSVSKVPIPSETDNQFYIFAVEHPDLVSDPTTFAYLWLDSRLARVAYIYENFIKYLRPAKLLP